MTDSSQPVSQPSKPKCKDCGDTGIIEWDTSHGEARTDRCHCAPPPRPSDELVRRVCLGGMRTIDEGREVLTWLRWLERRSPTPETREQREAFERFWNEHGGLLHRHTRNSDLYDSHGTAMAWAAWQRAFPVTALKVGVSK